jgi:HlyD family secretion protein
VLFCGLALIGALAFWWCRLHGRKPPSERYRIADVRRADLFPTRTASGRVESAKRTVIECQLERIAIGVRSRRLDAGGASILLKVIPEGSLVKRGDVLAVLDSSDYEELLRVQRIAVERAKANHRQAELDCEIAQLALREFCEGTMHETMEDFRRRITLAHSDLERAADRLNWSRRMKEKGYIAAGVVSSEANRVAQSEFIVKLEESACELFRKYTAPKMIRELEGAVKGAEVNLEYQDLRRNRHLSRLAMLEKQVKLCTIRAPHDGFVIYANDSRRGIYVEEGVPVRQRQTLFYLPDLDDMEVVAMLHESVVDEVRPGMRTKIKVESLPNHPIEGYVTSVAPLATQDWRSDVRYFEGIVKLENFPRGLRPGMTAEIEIAMPRRENVLAVPSEAVGHDSGHDVCFVVREDILERRPVKLGQVTREMTEVTEGLEEGEQIVLQPLIEADDVLTTGTTTEVTAAQAGSPPDSPPGVIAALH